MLKVLRVVRSTLRQWQTRPPAQRGRYRGRVQQIRSLVADLGGTRASGYVNGDSQAANVPADEDVCASRSRATVIADLQGETSRLVAALTPPASSLAMKSVPNGARPSGSM